MTDAAKIIVPALMRYPLPLSHVSRRTEFISGIRYGGSSNRKVEPCALNSVEPSTFATIIAMTIPMIYIRNTTFAALLGKNIAANSAMIGSFAPHVRNGVTRIEIMRSFSESSARAPIMDGTAQPKPIISGMIPLPVSPQRRMIGSVINAIRAM